MDLLLLFVATEATKNATTLMAPTEIDISQGIELTSNHFQSNN